MNKSLISSRLLATSLAALISASSLYAEDQQKQTAPAQTATAPAATPAQEPEIPDLKAEQMALLSEAFGHMLAKHIQSLGINFDVTLLVKGLQDANQGKTSPMDEMKCIETLGQARQVSFLKLAKKNLQEANEFMLQTAKKEGVKALEEGKLYYRIEKEGQGAAVATGNSPLIRYKGSFIDGKVFGASKEDDHVSLDETIPGFSRGLLGMKEGEKRTLYIHPELGYGTHGQLPPNSLLVFEIELVKAHAETGNAETVTSTASDQTEVNGKEISTNEADSSAKTSSTPGESAPAVR